MRQNKLLGRSNEFGVYLYYLKVSLKCELLTLVLAPMGLTIKLDVLPFAYKYVDNFRMASYLLIRNE